MVRKMNDLMPRKEFNKVWMELYNGAKKEIFRLQLLNTYLVEDEDQWFNAYKKGKFIPVPEDLEYFKTMERKKNGGVRILNLLVVDLPPSMYTKWVIDAVYTMTEKKGQETLVIERSNVANMTRQANDYWMFDNSVIIPMMYDKKGHFLGAGKLIDDKKELGKYVTLKDSLLKVAVPLGEFLNAHNIELLRQKTKNKNY